MVWWVVTDLVQRDSAELVLHPGTVGRQEQSQPVAEAGQVALQQPGTEARPAVLQVVQNLHLVLCGQRARR